MWDPRKYSRFADERARPFLELVGRVRCAPRRIVDLGCGPGSLTSTLCERWPDASVTGVDSSEAMLREAAPLAIPGRLEFALADLRTWEPDEPVDLLVANAVLQWVPGHIDLIGRLASLLSASGVLAFQVPGNYHAASHTILRDLRTSPAWRDRLEEGADAVVLVAEPSEYLEALLAAGLEPDVWETTYLQLLGGDDPVLDWLEGTALRPVLARLDPGERERFCAELAPLLRAAYPKGPGGTVLAYRRIFAIGSRPGVLVGG